MTDKKALLLELEKLHAIKCERSLKVFTKAAWEIIEPGTELVWNWHLDVICDFLEAFDRRDFRFGIINVPPRTSKSTIVSVCYPVWKWLSNPAHRFLCLSNSDDLVLRDAIASRDLIESEWFQKHWGHLFKFKDDQNEKKFYKNTCNGHRNSKSFSGRVTGLGGDTILIDDAHDADDAQSDIKRQSVIQTYDGKVISRLNDQRRGGILIVMQRLHEDDLTGHVEKKDPNKWVKLCLPMEYELDDDKRIVNPAKKMGFHDQRTKAGELLWPERFPIEVVKDLTKGFGEYGAAGQLQQRPAPVGGGILKKKWFKRWPNDKPFPLIEHHFISWDTAFTEEDMKTNSFSAYVGFGVFWSEEEQNWRLLVTRVWWDQVGYPDLRDKAISITKEIKPHVHLIEKKASGQSLIQDLRRSGIGVRAYNPDRDKIARAHSISAAVQAGLIYLPEREWANRVLDYLGTFPVGAPPCSDITDCFTQAVIYLLKGYWISHPDEYESEDNWEPKEVMPAYG